MIEFGKTLRAAREAKGYTIAQLCDITHLAPTAVENLENEDFSKIAAPIYGRGFIKLYCAAVGLEAKPMIDEFMEIFSGNRPVTIREIPADTQTQPASSPLPESQPATPEQLPTFDEPVSATITPPPTQQTFGDFQPPAPQPEPEPPASQPLPDDLLDVQPETEHPISRYATPLRTSHSLQISPSFWRMGLLVVVGLAFVILIGFGIRALYRATDPRANVGTESHLPASSAVAKPVSADPAVPRAPRTPIAVPPLYVD